MKKINIVLIVVLVLAIVAIVARGFFIYNKITVAPTDKSVYTNSEYGFELILTKAWSGFNVEKSSWQGWVINTGEQKYSGVKIVIKNPQTTASQQYQDIPIMVFTHDIWNMVKGENPTVSVSAAPIGPAEIGENTKYVFATPPRWYGFTDAIGFEEAVNILKTFKALN